jgi:hypothetical protein
MTIVGNAAFGLLIGLLLLLLLAFVGMSIGSLLVGALFIGVVTLVIYAILGRGSLSKPYWIAPTFSALPVSAAAAAGAPAWTFCACAATAMFAGIAGAYVGARLRSNNI